MQPLLHRLVDGLGIELQQCAERRGDRRADMRDMVDLVFVEANSFHQVDLDFVPGRNSANEVAAADALLLRDGQRRRNIVAGMGVVGGEEGIVIIQFAHRGAVRPGRPFGAETLIRRHAEDRRAAVARVADRHRAGIRHRAPVDRRHRNRRVVDHPVDDHIGHVVVDFHRVRRNGSDFPRELVFALEFLLRRIDLNGMIFHGLDAPALLGAGG